MEIELSNSLKTGIAEAGGLEQIDSILSESEHVHEISSLLTRDHDNKNSSAKQNLI